MSEESIFINRELSWLDFNRRVLVLGKDKNVPLAEQLKFLAIYGSNLDEFFMVRVGSLQERANLMRGKKEKRENKTNMTAEEQLAAIMPKTAQLQEDCDKYYAKALENLAACGYRKVDFDKLSKEDEHFWKKYFQSELFPILSPQIVDSRHPFPFLRNKEIYLGVLLHEKHTSEHTLGIVPISSQMERMHFVRKDNETCFALTEELVLHYAALIFGKENVQEKCLFRVTRNADIDVKEGMMDHDIDYREIMADLLKRRRKLAAVRLQVIPAAPQVAQLLCSRLELTHKRVFVQKSPLDLSFFYKLTSRMESDGHPELFYTPARPMLPPQDYDLAAEVEKHDVLLSYPYQSIRPFIAMLKKAAQDPDVISIKMTLYRMARESQIVQALVEAAENGKEVVALVELRARFDEQNNIDWSKHLEEAGCTVIYGFDDYKVHSKLTLITKKSAHGYSYITQIGTGNYNEKTSELYTDYSFITADLGIGEEASNVFQNLAVQKLTEESEKMLVAPLRFKSVLLDEMDRVINAARLGRPASMILKNNSISDRDIILKLEEASCAGVRIDMIVRGICCVRAGVPGKTENLHIRSLVGRYLEHGRIYSFYDGVNTRIYIASGDFLTRNTECRVEVGVRVEDPVLKEKLDSILRLQLSDNVNAREMQPDGSYLIACSADLDDMYDLFQVKGTCDAATVSGWVMEEVGKVPEVGDHFQSEGLDVTVTKVEHRRVLEIQVRVLPHDEEPKPREWELRGREKDAGRSKRAPQKPEP
ncbi:MAG: polyphosphate kinase 1 [Bacteroidales bacterium]|nr:polyphosphate kinase 1 [Bacteroidales bacterium]